MATVPRLQRYYQSATTSCPRIAFGSLPAGSAGACRFRVRHRRSRRRAGPATGRGLDFHAGNPPSSVLTRGQVQDLPGSLAIHPVTLRRSTTPDDPLRLAYSGASSAAPTQLTMKASSLHRFRGCTPLHHLLSTLHDGRYRTPCKTRFRLAGCAFAGRESNPLDRYERFQFIASSSPGLSLAQQPSRR
jgi:hypothetical protein